jgi:hypothetical protein
MDLKERHKSHPDPSRAAAAFHKEILKLKRAGASPVLKE